MSLFDFDYRTTRLAITGGLLAAAGTVLGSGCGGGGDTTTLAGFCQALATADCSNALVIACYGANDSTFDADLQQCIRARSATSVCNPSGLPYNAEFADGCISAHEQVYQATQLDPTAFDLLRQNCAPVFNKGGKVGTKCVEDTDCDVSGGLYCVVHQGKGATTVGTCQEPVPTMAGEKCTDPAAQCADGLFCQEAGYCVASPSAGDICGPGIKCEMGYFCDPDQNACVKQFSDTAPCNADDNCAGGFCVGGRCTATYSFAFGSATCQEFTGLK